MVWIAAQFSHAWNSTVYLTDFSGALDLSFALSLAYSILLKLGKFSGSSLDRWVFSEKIRIIPPLADNDQFDAPKFEKTLDGCRDHFKVFFGWINVIFVLWAIAAGSCDVIIFLLLPFRPDYVVTGATAFSYAAFLFGPLPMGLLVWAIAHGIARWRMNHHSKKGNTLIEFSKRIPEQKLEAARSLLRGKLLAEIDKNRVV